MHRGASTPGLYTHTQMPRHDYDRQQAASRHLYLYQTRRSDADRRRGALVGSGAWAPRRRGESVAPARPADKVTRRRDEQPSCRFVTARPCFFLSPSCTGLVTLPPRTTPSHRPGRAPDRPHTRSDSPRCSGCQPRRASTCKKSLPAHVVQNVGEMLGLALWMAGKDERHEIRRRGWEAWMRPPSLWRASLPQIARLLSTALGKILAVLTGY